ncbi:MAG: nucleoside-diphosphate sugar epimerase/dehydratase [Bacillota bacterium]|nr:nucleoside-diphosphate sugar epimerase/dehydratase [Bacillota bacterium]
MQRKIRTIFLVLLDVIIINLDIIIALFMRFGLDFSSINIENIISQAPQIIIIKIVVFAYFRLYKSLWQYASIDELLQVFNGVVVANTLTVTYLFLLRVEGFPRSIILLMGMLDLLFIGGSRLSYRVFRRMKQKYLISDKDKKKILIIGAGDAGAMIAKEFNRHIELNSKPVVFLDDDKLKQNKIINGIKVIGKVDEVELISKKEEIDEIIIAVPSTSNKRIKEIINLTKNTKCKVKIVPAMNDILSGELSLQDIREINIEDLLGRDQVKLNMDSMKKYIEEKVILITGGGGSIGSELCRQVARFKPKKLIIFDIYENNAYSIQNELLRKYDGKINLDVVIGTVRDKNRIEEIMKDNKIDIIFHAAAHKHVPLMERSPKEAIKNNIFGTKNVAEYAIKFKVPKFVMISTDKAVNPTNIMGATKRVCEMIIQSLNDNDVTDFVAVRFGNVLGSNGSVIPLFKEQIKEGGPVTVTHEEVTRYFMTIPEASKLVIQAGAMAKGGEIFILDMGEPVKIIDLAKDLIKLSGLQPYEDIDIEVVGLRPGEKLYEELLLNEKENIKTSNRKIFVEKSTHYDKEELKNKLSKLNRVEKKQISKNNICALLDDIIGTFEYDGKYSNITKIK